MKCTIDSNASNGFWISLTAETAEEAGLLASMKINERREAPDLFVCANNKGICADIVIKQKSEFKSYVESR